MGIAERFQARRAIESLRAGVPNDAAVDALGLQHSALLADFERNCDSAGDSQSTGRGRRGFFIEGNFGSGKSHALRYLQFVASKRQLASSHVAISKETQLGDLGAVYRSAIGNLALKRGTLSGSLAAVFESIDPRSAAFTSLCAALSDSREGLDPLFRASVLLFKRCRADSEIVEQLCDFWDGGPPQVGAWKSIVRDVDASAIIRSTKAAELAPQRFRFAAHCLSAAGYKGWFIAIDEMELLAKFSVKSRATAYSSLAFMFGDNPTYPSSRLWFSVGAVTEDLLGEVLGKRNDSEEIPRRFRWDETLVSSAASGIALLSDRERRFRLFEPGFLDLRRAQEKIHELYELAYGFRVGASSLPDSGRLSKSMRSYVREWIAECDLRFQDPTYQPSIQSRETDYDLSEDSDLEPV